MQADNYKQVSKDFADYIYRNERVEILYAPALKLYSKLGESEEGFRSRLSTSARELRDEAVEKLRDKYESKIRTKMDQIERAENTLMKEEAESSSANWQIGAKVIGGLLGGLLGGRRSSSSSAVTSASRAYKQRSDVKVAKRKIRDLEEDQADLEGELREEIAELKAEYDSSQLKLEKKRVKPFKKDISVTSAALLWLPYNAEGEKAWS